MESKIEIYKDQKTGIDLTVKLENDTVWLDQSQMSKLFGRERSVITKHIQNVFKDGELSEISNVQNLHIANSDKPIKLYNLDVIISVGYRVKSIQGTQFRIWATNILKKYLVNGYAINQKLLIDQSKKYQGLQKYLKTLGAVVKNEEFTLETSKQLMQIISDYAESINLLDKVDKNELSMPKFKNNTKAIGLNYNEAKNEIDKLRTELHAGELFGNEKDKGFESALKTIFQTFDGKDLYPSIEEKAAHLLYMIIKNHSFTDGNKRIGAFMFIRFLDINGILYRPNKSKLVEPNALVAIALLIAQSDPKDKDLMVNLVVNLISTKDE